MVDKRFYMLDNEIKLWIEQTYSPNKINKVLNRLRGGGTYIRLKRNWEKKSCNIYKEFVSNHRIVKLEDGIEMWLPYVKLNRKKVCGDYLQREILLTQDYFERDELNNLRDILNTKNHEMNICDIGANIGNHTLYFLKHINASHVYSFEPVRKTYDILKKNIELNHYESKTTLYNCALGNRCGKGVSHVLENNCGGNSVEYSDAGDVAFLRLDDIQFEGPVNFCKIDVEGFEYEVLKGGKDFLERNKPILFIEVFDKNYDKVNGLLCELGYEQKRKLWDNYIYYHE